MSDKLLKPLLDYLSKNDIPSKLRPPPNCPKHRLKDIFTAQKGRVPETLCSEFNDQAKPYINIKAFERGIYDYYVQSDDGVPVHDDELVIVWDGARSGLVGKGQDGILGSTLKKLTLKPAFSKSLLPYFYFFLQQQYPYINRMGRGSVIKHVDPTTFWNLEIPIPDKDSERFEKITKIVGAIEMVEEHTQRNLKLVQNMKQAVLHTSFYLPK